MDLVALANRIANTVAHNVAAANTARADIVPEPASTIEEVAAMAMVATVEQDPRVAILEAQLAALREQLSTALARVDRLAQANMAQGSALPPLTHAARPRTGREPSVELHGQAYMVRHLLKAIGCYWNADDRVWMAPESRQAQAQAIIDNA